LQVLSVIAAEEKSLAELASVMEIFPQILLNVPVKKKTLITEVPLLCRQIAEVEKIIEGRGRLLIRYSGTENKLRIMLEGENYDEIKKHAEDLAGTVHKVMG
ncbi:MAG: phosphoglucosamine mutase, partial [Deltaproteobacteria bacterium]|nr:phosphoglucosamine mutase [Deltaproteobacteria bacterium]